MFHCFHHSSTAAIPTFNISNTSAFVPKGWLWGGIIILIICNERDRSHDHELPLYFLLLASSNDPSSDGNNEWLISDNTNMKKFINFQQLCLFVHKNQTFFIQSCRNLPFSGGAKRSKQMSGVATNVYLRKMLEKPKSKGRRSASFESEGSGVVFARGRY